MVVAFHAATLATGRALPLTRTGLSPVGTRQLSWRTKGRHFEASLILQAVSWYLRYPLNYRPPRLRKDRSRRSISGA